MDVYSDGLFVTCLRVVSTYFDIIYFFLYHVTFIYLCLVPTSICIVVAIIFDICRKCLYYVM